MKKKSKAHNIDKIESNIILFIYNFHILTINLIYIIITIYIASSSIIITSSFL